MNMVDDKYPIPPSGGVARHTQFDDKTHTHEHGQLTYTAEGVLYLQIDNRLFIIPPNMGIYIPPNCQHRVSKDKALRIENVYFDQEHLDLLPAAPQLIHLSRLAIEIIAKICTLKNKEEYKLHNSLFNILVQEIKSSPHIDYAIKIPTDSRLLKIYTLFNENQQLKFPSLSEAAAYIHVSDKTLTRLFIKDTGLNFVTWKQQFLFTKAIELLQQYKQTTLVAYQLGYNSESAFITMFKKMSGGKKPSYFWRK